MANTCEEYSSQITVDRNWMVARTVGILALVISGVHALIVSWLSLGRKKSCSSTSLCAKISPWIYLLCCLLQALTLIVLRSEFCNQSLKQSVESLLERATIEWGECKLESGSHMAMASAVCWFLAFALAIVHTIGRRSLSATAIAVGENDECNTNEQPNQNTILTVRSKGVELDEETIAVEAEVSPPAAPKTTDSVSSKAAIVSPTEMSTPAAQSSPKTKNSPSEQKTSNNADNENKVPSIEARNVSISSSRATSTTGRRRAKYR